MKKYWLDFIAITLVFLSYSISVAAQGIIVHKKDGTKIMVPYEQFDSISTYDYNDEAWVQVDSLGHKYVDLGLSVKWAACNIGAKHSEEYGDYFAWGETIGSNNREKIFNASSYKYCRDDNIKDLTKYCTLDKYGSVDNKTTLEPGDDAATVNWGGKWRMPTRKEFEELKNNCEWTWYDKGNTEFYGVPGYKVRSLKQGYNNSYIFLPASGLYNEDRNPYLGTDGSYWGSSLDEEWPYCACRLSFRSTLYGVYDFGRYYGLSIRPVLP